MRPWQNRFDGLILANLCLFRLSDVFQKLGTSQATSAVARNFGRCRERSDDGRAANFRRLARTAYGTARQVAAWLGLVPRQDSSGGKPKLLGISKRGDVYLRTLLIHGARAVVKTAAKKDDTQSRWINNLVKRRNANIAAVAVANKNARIVWALLTKSEHYDVSAQARV